MMWTVTERERDRETERERQREELSNVIVIPVGCVFV